MAGKIFGIDIKPIINTRNSRRKATIPQPPETIPTPQLERKPQKIVVSVIVYNRFENLQRWLRCWMQCEKYDAEFVVIHNADAIIEGNQYQLECEKYDIRYIQRRNIGFDIGAFQDVCRNRLAGFPTQYDLLFWVTDDTIPMSRDFLGRFISTMYNKNVAVACTEISREVAVHIRTSGFMVRRTVMDKIQFVADPITTKRQCYEFEHIGELTFFKQIKALGLFAQMPVAFPNGDLWDIQHRAKHNRWTQHRNVFSETNATIKIEPPAPIDYSSKKVTIICPIYNSYPQIISSLICQTHKNWHLLLIHDGENSTGLKKIVDDANDDRITYFETKERGNVWGHDIRKFALENIDSLVPYSDYVVITNPDNYHVPTYIEYMLSGFGNGIVATYCGKFVHAYPSNQRDCTDKQDIVYRWGVIKSRLELGWVDCGGVMVQKDVANEVGWRSMEIYSDWTYFEDIVKKYGIKSFNKVNGCLLVHN